MRKIALVTGTRAEYGLMYFIMKGIQDDPELELQLIVTGTHLSPEYGMTVESIEKDGFTIAERIEIPLSSDSEVAVATSMGLAVAGLANAYERLVPDLLLILGDRYEIFSAAAAAVFFKIPIAHIHGGESTEGAMDELFRHAITKMSHIHFPATLEYAERVIQMGENPEHVHCFGAPGVDNIYKFGLLRKDELTESLGISPDEEIGIVTYHPVTLGEDSPEGEIQEVLEALLDVPSIFWIITYPNADVGSKRIVEKIEEFGVKYPKRCKVFISLGQLRYLSVLKYAQVMVGNSSSGLIEAPSFKLPVVNIGRRQEGRVRAMNVIDVPVCRKDEIVAAIDKSLSPRFQESLKDMKNPYGDEAVSDRIVQALKTVRLDERLIKKHFYVKP